MGIPFASAGEHQYSDFILTHYVFPIRAGSDIGKLSALVAVQISPSLKFSWKLYALISASPVWGAFRLRHLQTGAQASKVEVARQIPEWERLLSFRVRTWRALTGNQSWQYVAQSPSTRYNVKFSLCRTVVCRWARNRC